MAYIYFLCIYRCFHLRTCISVDSAICLSVNLPIHLHIYLYIYTSIHPFCQSIIPSIIHPNIFPIHSSICPLSMYLSTHILINPPIPLQYTCRYINLCLMTIINLSVYRSTYTCLSVIYLPSLTQPRPAQAILEYPTLEYMSLV
jgi:hypothetical protein